MGSNFCPNEFSSLSHVTISQSVYSSQAPPKSVTDEIASPNTLVSRASVVCVRTHARCVCTSVGLSVTTRPRPRGSFPGISLPAFPELSLLCFVISAASGFENESHYRNDSWQPSCIPFCFEMDDAELLALKGPARGATTRKRYAGGSILSPKTVLNIWTNTALCALGVNWKILIMS